MFSAFTKTLKDELSSVQNTFTSTVTEIKGEVSKHATTLAADVANARSEVSRASADISSSMAKSITSGPMGALTAIRQQMSQQMGDALARHDSAMVNQILDNAMAQNLLGRNAPSVVRNAAMQQAREQLRAAIDSGSAKRLKGALVAAKRLNATELPEFEEAILKYKEVRQLPLGWDVSQMVLHREGARMVAKLKLDDPVVFARFQRLLDLTHRKVYTRDRLGQPVPERLQLLTVSAVTNDESWGHYVARREAVRQELNSDISNFQRYEVDTQARTTGDEALDTCGESAEAIAGILAEDFASPLMAEVNEVFLYHGTSASAAEAIKTHDFRINLAGTNAGTLYGRGIYLAENGTKSDEYTTPMSDGVRHLLVCRVVLGRVYYTDTKDTDPRACEDACLKGKFNSVLGDRKKCRGTFREFIVFDEEQVYTNYILTYKRVATKSAFCDVTCPDTALPGTVIHVQTPDGLTIQAQVPAGVQPGDTFSVQYTPKD